MQARPSVAVLGFRPHTYWTAVVALGGAPDAPQVVERRRIVFAAGQERMVFHRAAEDVANAEAMIAEVRAATMANATREVERLLAELRGRGVSVGVAATAAATAKLPERLEDIFRVHARMHAAEGSFYRDVVAEACKAAGLAVHRVVERELPALVCDLIEVSKPSLDARLKAIGAAIGPPWSEDYRLAAEAAWLHLEAAGAGVA